MRRSYSPAPPRGAMGEMVERCGNQIDGEGAKRVGKTIVKVNEK